ncbi:MAG: aldehyde dehydrogenase family protein [Bacteroidota bacterium]
MSFPKLLPDLQQQLNSEQLLLINGEWVRPQAGHFFESINPATGEPITAIAQADEQDVDQAAQAAQMAYREHWSKMAPAERARLLWRLADLIERDRELFIQLETLDNGKPLAGSYYDVSSAIKHFRYYAGWADKIEGSTIPVPQKDTFTYVRKEALGVVGLIVPWNFPLMMAAWKLAPALACGNCCLLKPAEQTCLTALQLGRLSIEAGFPAGVINILTGPGLPTGDAIARHPGIAKLSFTGSTATGQKIMTAAAATNLKRISLELGGKSPNIIFADADLEAVSQTVLWSSFYNAGQECTLGSRIFIERPIYEQVVERLSAAAQQLKVGPGWEAPDLGPLISEQQLSRVDGYVQRAKNQAELVTGGIPLQGKLANGYFYAPTIFAHTDDELEIAREEVFGPVVCVSPFDEQEEVIQRANNNPYGLAAAIWTKSMNTAQKCINDLQAGTIWVNAYDLFDPAVPFGGWKASGFGREMGKSAIDLFTAEKSVWVKY